ncbi:MAG: hypothetical protein E7591_00850 [Ruminococcaceae bacterium]|nr:hypothetical protein [Oscillospiraceae bacterium]
MSALDSLENKYKELQECYVSAVDRFIANSKVLHSVFNDIVLLEKENAMLWSKLAPIPATTEVVDYEYDMKIIRCPCCGNRLFKKKAFCESCGQALATESQRKAGTAEGRKIEEKELEDIINLNDRS